MLTSRALLRWPAICGLAVLLAVLIPLTWLSHKVTGAGLIAAEWAKAEFKRLTREPAPPLDPYVQRALDRAEGR
jgi:hypothetical protein